MRLQGIKRYAAYKDSGVEWLGYVPAHWNLKRFKDFVDILSGYSPEEVKPDLHGNTAYYKVDDLNSLSKTGHITKSTWHTNYIKCVYRKNILLLPKRGMSILTNKVGITDIECIFDTNLMGLRLSQKHVDIKFIFYWTINVGLSKLADITTIPQLNNKHIYPIVIQLPNRAEQTAIATYLDTKTAQIDRQIDLLSQKAAQYGKLKQSLINETVTRGLDKTVLMKDSGVEWIGEVPVHWESGRIKDFVNTNAVTKVPDSLAGNDLIEFLPMTNVNDALGKIKKREFK
jgi:type I restriction enzyme S subunit